MHNFYTGRKEQFPAQSCYVAVNHNGKTYHLFNAKRMPVGRMAVQISQFIRGKHRPGYKKNATNESAGNSNLRDKCIIVNMANPYFTGRKR